MWHMFVHPFFKGFSNLVFRSVALVTKKVWAFIDFFYTDRIFKSPVPYSVPNKNIYTKFLRFLSKLRNKKNERQNIPR